MKLELLLKLIQRIPVDVLIDTLPDLVTGMVGKKEGDLIKYLLAQAKVREKLPTIVNILSDPDFRTDIAKFIADVGKLMRDGKRILDQAGKTQPPTDVEKADPPSVETPHSHLAPRPGEVAVPAENPTFLSYFKIDEEEYNSLHAVRGVFQKHIDSITMQLRFVVAPYGGGTDVSVKFTIYDMRAGAVIEAAGPVILQHLKYVASGLLGAGQYRSRVPMTMPAWDCDIIVDVEN